VFVAVLLIILTSTVYIRAEEAIFVQFFYSTNCKSCIYIKDLLQKNNNIKTSFYNIDEYSNFIYFRKIAGNKKIKVPVIVVNEEYAVCGKKNIKEFIDKRYSDKKVNLNNIETKLKGGYGELPLLMITFAGLIDGLNPCAFATIIFIVSFLTYKKYSRKEILIVGIFFSLSVLITYILIGLGLFNFIYKFSGFLTINRFFYFLLSLLCFYLGGISGYDAYKIHKGAAVSELKLQLPMNIKKIIHGIIRKLWGK